MDILEIAWDILENAKLQILRRDFETLFMKDIDSINRFMTKMKHVVNKLCSYGEDISDQKVVEKVLKSLPEKFGMVIVAIEAKDITKIYVEELMGSLLTHETSMRQDSRE